jgi:hypothetical protein
MGMLNTNPQITGQFCVPKSSIWTPGHKLVIRDNTIKYGTYTNCMIPIIQKAGWAPGLVWTIWRREKSLALARNLTPIPQLTSQLLLLPAIV